MTITLDPRRQPVTRRSNGTVDHTPGAWTLRVSTEHEEDALLPFPENDFMLEVLTAERTSGGWIVRGWTDSDDDRPVGEPEFALALPGSDRDWLDACEAVVDALG